jgi:hypothetical protein
MRLIEGIPVDRARLRFTGTYAVTERLSLGLEANPLDDDYGLIGNFRAVDETRRRPALIFGTSSDRIGTPSGRAYYGTFSKDLEALTGLPIAPYTGLAFGEFEDEWEWIGGLHVRWLERLSTTSLWDGENLHHTAEYRFDGGFRAGVVVAEQDGKHYLGATAGYSF